MRAWDRLEDESPKAYAAFCAYYLLPVTERSIDRAALKSAPESRQGRAPKIAPRHWHDWSSRFDWVARADAYDQHLRDENERAWEEKRKAMRERDWAQGLALRDIVDQALPGADRFLRHSRVFVKGENGEPDKEVITVAFDISALTRVLVEASKLQRLATDESTDNINFRGKSLDDAIEREVKRLLGGDDAA